MGGDDADDPAFAETKEILDSLVVRMIKCEPEDFELVGVWIS